MAQGMKAHSAVHANCTAPQAQVGASSGPDAPFEMEKSYYRCV